MYCEKCKVLFDGRVCPQCGSSKVREPKDNDECFLTEKEMIWGEMLADVLNENHIPFYYKKTLGAGMAMKVGPNSERYRFFVPFSRLTVAQDVTEGLFQRNLADHH